MKYKKIKVVNELYRSELSVYIGDAKLVKKKLLSIGITKSDVKDMENSAGVFMNGKDYKIIFLHKNNIEDLSHEVTHYVFSLLQSRGIPINYKNDEVVAYLIGHTLSKILSKTQKTPH